MFAPATYFSCVTQTSRTKETNCVPPFFSFVCPANMKVYTINFLSHPLKLRLRMMKLNWIFHCSYNVFSNLKIFSFRSEIFVFVFELNCDLVADSQPCKREKKTNSLPFRKILNIGVSFLFSNNLILTIELRRSRLRASRSRLMCIFFGFCYLGSPFRDFKRTVWTTSNQIRQDICIYRSAVVLIFTTHNRMAHSKLLLNNKLRLGANRKIKLLL